MKDVYADLYKNEERYWWSIIRRKIALAMWRRFRQEQADYRMLDVGCGGGAFLAALSENGQAFGIDSSFKACGFSKNNKILQADILQLPFKDNSFTAIFALDLIEHVEDESGLLRQIYRVCRQQGIFIITAPAFNCLWSERDEYLGHKRRYTIKALESLIREAGFKVLKSSYIYTLLFPALYLRNRISPVSRCRKIKTDIFSVPAAINAFLVYLFGMEIKLLRHLSLPWGSSVICVAQKNKYAG